MTFIVNEVYSVFRYVLPAVFQWPWQKYIKGDIKTETLNATINNVSASLHLNLHGEWRANRKTVLLCHGDFSHPLTLLHLAEKAKKAGLNVFSVFISRIDDYKRFEVHQELLGQAIQKISLTANSILFAGHSKGAIFGAYRQFVLNDTRIKALCAIAGPLKASRQTGQARENTLNIVHQAMLANPAFQTVQIIPKEDWNDTQDSMNVRPDTSHFVPGSHLGGLYKKETENLFQQFLLV